MNCECKLSLPSIRSCCYHRLIPSQCKLTYITGIHWSLPAKTFQAVPRLVHTIYLKHEDVTWTNNLSSLFDISLSLFLVSDSITGTYWYKYIDRSPFCWKKIVWKHSGGNHFSVLELTEYQIYVWHTYM